MHLTEAITSRYSCRTYTPRPVEPEILNRILDAGRLAPSAKNLQDWRFVVVTDPKLRKKIAQAAYEQMFLSDAGAIIVACSINSYIMRCGQSAGPIDVAIALEHIALAATDLGLATCWIGSFYPEKVRDLLAIPENVAIIELMALGYPADKPKTPSREPLEKIVCYDNWQF